MQLTPPLEQPSGTLTVFTDDPSIKEGLTDPRFVISEDPNS